MRFLRALALPRHFPRPTACFMADGGLPKPGHRPPPPRTIMPRAPAFRRAKSFSRPDERQPERRNRLRALQSHCIDQSLLRLAPAKRHRQSRLRRLPGPRLFSYPDKSGGADRPKLVQIQVPRRRSDRLCAHWANGPPAPKARPLLPASSLNTICARLKAATA